MTSQKVQTIFVGILTIIAMGAVLHFLRGVFIPLVIAALLSTMLSPLVSNMGKMKIPRILGILFVMVAMFVLLFIVGRLFYSSLQHFTGVLGSYLEDLKSMLQQVWKRFEIPQEFFPKFSWTQNMISRLIQLSGGFVNFGTNLGLVLLFLIFMLGETPLSWRKFRRAFPHKLNNQVGLAITDVARQVARYLTIKTIISAVTGISVWLTLKLVGQDLAAMWGFMAFFLNFIPNLGSFFIIACTMLMGLVQFHPQWNKIITVWILMPGIQIMMGNIVDPMIQGHHLDLSPLVILISLVIWGWIWGITGMFLAVPLTVALKIILSHIPKLQPFSIMMGAGEQPNATKP